ncbi:hypothetical protein pEaSNUABM50_00441 [Erwinia phage pEa_SNUABM_50]|uniref:Cyclic-phosphate processing Receiver domain-containing protein n=2 Tax=Eneladusvirus BF TaxID=2560751 RepID=A0A7L8ZNQ5_9CAUD|nr:hypothetical protein pEaSNUABM47_00443 [Erwinia phage pEa_SNUABM_47]QOI72456.1 hypothetical protein pEaSNUABM50_00441 [Erwinia phage pEa_SNUABM_50]QXO12131.1 hypothetical protein pEaSNUABM44_00445 [Erwinia phage pEa_SNUABM_44]
MKVYVDDIRNPQNHLSSEQAADVVWIKEWWDARNFIFYNNLEIEVIHLDNYLGDRTHTGADLLRMITYRFRRGEFPKLKQIYLHSSDKDIVNKLYDTHIERCTEAGVELIKNSRPNRS